MMADKNVFILPNIESLIFSGCLNKNSNTSSGPFVILQIEKCSTFRGIPDLVLTWMVIPTWVCMILLTFRTSTMSLYEAWQRLILGWSGERPVPMSLRLFGFGLKGPDSSSLCQSSGLRRSDLETYWRPSALNFTFGCKATWSWPAVGSSSGGRITWPWLAVEILLVRLLNILVGSWLRSWWSPISSCMFLLIDGDWNGWWRLMLFDLMLLVLVCFWFCGEDRALPFANNRPGEGRIPMAPSVQTN